MRVLFAREHATVYPGKGVFLAGPTPPDGEMVTGWRRTIVSQLKSRHDLDDEAIVVSPEPVEGAWHTIVSPRSHRYATIENDQIAWELQYLNLCAITAFWLPMYWDDGSAECFPANIGPTTRWEFGMMLERYLNAPSKRTLIVGGPEDAQSIGWARHVAKQNNIYWHSLPKAEKNQQVATSFIDAIAEAVSVAGKRTK